MAGIKIRTQEAFWVHFNEVGSEKCIDLVCIIFGKIEDLFVK